MRSTTRASTSSTASDLLRREMSTFILPVPLISGSSAMPTVESPPSARIAYPGVDEALVRESPMLIGPFSAEAYASTWPIIPMTA